MLYATGVNAHKRIASLSGNNIASCQKTFHNYLNNGPIKISVRFDLCVKFDIPLMSTNGKTRFLHMHICIYTNMGLQFLFYVLTAHLAISSVSAAASSCSSLWPVWHFRKQSVTLSFLSIKYCLLPLLLISTWSHQCAPHKSSSASFLAWLSKQGKCETTYWVDLPEDLNSRKDPTCCVCT
jgi:hypothetical protein